MGQADAPKPLLALRRKILHRHDDELFAFRSTPTFARALPAPIGLVDLDHAGEFLAPRPDHGPPELVQPLPGRMVAAQTQHALGAQGISSVFLAGDAPDGRNQGWSGFLLRWKRVPAVLAKEQSPLLEPEGLA